MTDARIHISFTSHSLSPISLCSSLHLPDSFSQQFTPLHFRSNPLAPVSTAVILDVICHPGYLSMSSPNILSLSSDSLSNIQALVHKEILHSYRYIPTCPSYPHHQNVSPTQGHADNIIKSAVYVAPHLTQKLTHFHADFHESSGKS